MVTNFSNNFFSSNSENTFNLDLDFETAEKKERDSE
jgi:hypothetical protein